MRTIVALAGFACSGKDYTCQKIIETLPNFKRYGLADFLKELMGIVLDMNLEQLNEWKCDPNNRQKMIDFSEIGIKKVDKEFWIKKFAIDFERDDFNYVITDMRYWDEYYFLLHKYLHREDVILKTVYVNAIGTEVYDKCGNEISSNRCMKRYDNYFHDQEMYKKQFNRLIDFIKRGR